MLNLNKKRPKTGRYYPPEIKAKNLFNTFLKTKATPRHFNA